MNLTLAQIKTLDCGSKRLPKYREKGTSSLNGVINLYRIFSALQLTYPGTRISTLREVFEFVQCADPQRQISWNIESKINPILPNNTRGVADFVGKQHKAFVDSSYSLSQITVRFSSPSESTVSKIFDSIRALTGGR